MISITCHTLSGSRSTFGPRRMQCSPVGCVDVPNNDDSLSSRVCNLHKICSSRLDNLKLEKIRKNSPGREMNAPQPIVQTHQNQWHLSVAYSGGCEVTWNSIFSCTLSYCLHLIFSNFFLLILLRCEGDADWRWKGGATTFKGVR